MLLGDWSMIHWVLGHWVPGHCFEPAMRVPMFLHCPSLIPAKTVSKVIVANIDLGPTLLDGAGIGEQAMHAVSKGPAPKHALSFPFTIWTPYLL